MKSSFETRSFQFQNLTTSIVFSSYGQKLKVFERGENCRNLTSCQKVLELISSLERLKQLKKRVLAFIVAKMTPGGVGIQTGPSLHSPPSSHIPNKIPNPMHFNTLPTIFFCSRMRICLLGKIRGKRVLLSSLLGQVINWPFITTF